MQLTSIQTRVAINTSLLLLMVVQNTVIYKLQNTVICNLYKTKDKAIEKIRSL